MHSQVGLTNDLSASQRKGRRRQRQCCSYEQCEKKREIENFEGISVA